MEDEGKQNLKDKMTCLFSIFFSSLYMALISTLALVVLQLLLFLSIFGLDWPLCVGVVCDF